MYCKELKNYDALSLGDSIGEKWSKDKYFIPYLRDYVMDYGCICDVAESTFTWQQLEMIYPLVKSEMEKEFKKLGVSGYLGCHLSHTYATGACLYFTFACSGTGMENPLASYYQLKRRITDLFVDNGASISHHHAVGIEHRPWIEKE